MCDNSIRSVYNLYELFNDFNRIRILLYLNKEEKTLEDISSSLNLNKMTVMLHIEYLKSYNIVAELTNKKKTSYKIMDMGFLKIVNDMLNYIK